MVDGTESDLKDIGSGHDSAGEQPDWEDLLLSPEHVAMLVASGITSKQAQLRGYETIPDGQPLPYKFSYTHADGLLIPQLDVDGEVWGYQVRLEVPAYKGQWAPGKYMTRHGDPHRLDIPPGVNADMLGDPDEPLWLTEGVKKADCGAAHGLCIVDVSGGWSWYGGKRLGGPFVLGGWKQIALEGRKAIICYDGDDGRKRELRSPMSDLVGFLVYQGAHVSFAWLPDAGLDDYLQDHTVDELHQSVHTFYGLRRSNFRELSDWFDDIFDGDSGKCKQSAATQLVATPGENPNRRSSVFTAKYPGKCGICGKRFWAGASICFIAEKTLAHGPCTSEWSS